MKLKSQLIQTVLLQGAGAVSILVTVMALGLVLGPAQQGQFNRVKAEVEFCGAVSMLGLPQALFYFVKSVRMEMRRALRWALVAPAVAVPVALVYMLATSIHASWAAYGLLCCAAVACSWHGVLRGLILADASTWRFNVITSLPQVLLLAFAVVLMAWRAAIDTVGMMAAFAVVYGVSAAFARRSVARLTGSAAAVHQSVNPRAILNYGSAAWMTGSFSTAAVVTIQKSVETGSGPVGLGLFAMGMTLAQIPLTPVNYAVPILFRHWVGGTRSVPYRPLMAVTASLVVAAAIVFAIGTRRPDFWMGTRYHGLSTVLSALLLAAAGDISLKILTVACHSSAQMWPPVIAEGSRCILVALLSLLAGGLLPLPAAVAWVTGSWCAVAVLVLIHKRQSRGTK